MKIRYSIIEKLHNLSSCEMNLFLYIAMIQDVSTGAAEGVYYRDVIKHTGMCKQSFYNALKGLEEKKIVTITRASSLDYDISIFNNNCGTAEERSQGYVNLNRKVFHSKQFRALKAHEKYMLLNFLKSTHENGHSHMIGIDKLYEKYTGLLGVTRRVIRSYLHRLRKFFSIGIKDGKYYITYLHSVFRDRTDKAEEKWYLEALVQKECNRQHISYEEKTIADTAVLINQYKLFEHSNRKRIETVMSCIVQSIAGTRFCERMLQPKYIHKLVRSALGIPETV